MEKRKNLHKRLGQVKRDADLRILKRLIRGPPVFPRELIKELDLERNTVNYHLSRFIKYNIVKKLKDKRYAFITYIESEETVVQIVKRWRKIAFCDPLPVEIANETQMSVQEAEELARKTRDKTGWSMPNQAVQDRATEKLGEVLGYLTRKRDGKLKDFDYKDDPEIVEEAELGLKEHLEMLPKLDDDGNVVFWSSKALKYLRKNYKLKERYQPYVAVVFGPEHNPWRPR